MPERIPAHYGFSGNVNRYGSKYELLVLPILTVLMGIFWVLMLKFVLKDKEKGAQNIKFMFYCDMIMTLTFTVLSVWTLYVSYTQAESIYDAKFDFVKIFALFMSISYVLIGNFLPKCKQNPVVGIRTKWTLASETTWYKTHRFGGKVFILAGILSAMLCLLVSNSFVALYLSLSGLAVPIIPIVIYSYRVYKLETQ
jgi:uncharacterized membrane protein